MALHSNNVGSLNSNNVGFLNSDNVGSRSVQRLLVAEAFLSQGGKSFFKYNFMMVK